MNTLLPTPTQTDRPTQLLEVSWQAGAENCAFVSERISKIPGGATDLFIGVANWILTYLLGPFEDNIDFWRIAFGNPDAFRRVTEMTLTQNLIPREPHLLCLWAEETLIARIASSDFIVLRELQHKGIIPRWQEAGCKATSKGFGPKGLVVELSKK